MEKRMKVMLLCVAILFGGIFLWKAIGGWLFYRQMKKMSFTPTVSAMTVGSHPWRSTLKATGSLRAIKGVNVTTELAGMVKKIHFIPGTMVKENELLVELNADAEIGQLQSLTAQAVLAQLTYARDQAQYGVHAISKQILDTDLQNWKSLLGQVAQQEAVVSKKNIRAPFSGKLGINNVNPGQYVNPGDTIVTLQQLSPIYMDFYMPQQYFKQIELNQPVMISSDAFPGKQFTGTITAVNPLVEVTTRNVLVEATLANAKQELAPGMFASATITTGAPQNYLTVPQTAISFNPYGNVVYLLTGKPNALKVKKVFVITGETRGDQVTILKGLKNGDRIVTSGQLKLKNDMTVVIDNSIVPENHADVTVSNEH